MKNTLLINTSFLFLLLSSTAIAAVSVDSQTNKATGQQNTALTEQAEAGKIVALSKQKWQWMADKNVAELVALFHDESKFVHMSGSWKKARELDIIERGSIWYKNTLVHDVDVEIVGDTAVVWSRITLEAHVRGNDVVTEFTATEVYVKSAANWQLLALTFSSVRDTHKIEH